ncbi:hypothetical protein WCLP8_1880016 [uncultured Gammaproteobacteria bacterium]
MATIPREVDWRAKHQSPFDMTAAEKDRYDRAYAACGCQVFTAQISAGDEEFDRLEEIIIAATPATIQGLAVKLRFTWLYDRDYRFDLDPSEDVDPSQRLLWQCWQAAERLAEGTLS